MTSAIVIFIYLAVVLYIGIFAFRKRATGEDFFMASRSVGSIFFFLSLFATNMTAFAILGSSGQAYKQGIGIYGMMASSSCLIIPLTLLVIGTRLWAIGKRLGHMTQVQFFRDRWECSSIGTFYFLVTAALLLPYLIISITGGGTILETLTNGKIHFALGGAIVALVVMGTVFFGGMRGAVWVNVFQTLLFLCFGVVAVALIDHDINFTETVKKMLAPTPDGKPNPLAWALSRTRGDTPVIPTTVFFSFFFIPLSSIMFPHMSIMCMAAKRVTAFKKSVILYPLCIMAIWAPCVYLGAIATSQPEVGGRMAAGSEEVQRWMESGGQEIGPNFKLPLLLAEKAGPGGKALLAQVANHELTTDQFAEALFKIVGQIRPPAARPASTLATTAAAAAPTASTRAAAGGGVSVIILPTIPAEVRRLAGTNSDSVLLLMLKMHVAPIIAGILAAGIISAVMGSDCHQILALSTMFTKDIFDYYGGRKRFGDKGDVRAGRIFIILINSVAYLIALGKPPIFELAISYAFAGFASLSPVMIAALFWKRSTKYGALASALVAAIGVILTGYFEHAYKPGAAIWTVGGNPVIWLSAPAGKVAILGYSPVVPMLLFSILGMIVVSLLTPRPSQPTIDRYFSEESGQLSVASGQ